MTHSRKKKSATVGEDEYFENREEYNEQYGINSSADTAILNQLYRFHLITHLDELVRERVVEERQLPIKETSIPMGDWEK